MTASELVEPYKARVQALARSLSSKAESLLAAKTEGATHPREPVLELLSDTLRLWSEFLTNTHVQSAYAESALHPGTSTWVDDNHVGHIEERVRALTLPLDSTWAATTGNELRALLRSLVQRSDLLEPALPGQEGTELLQFKYSVLLRLQQLDERALQDAVVRANRAAVESEKNQEATARAAGITGDATMSSYYSKLAVAEAKDANNFRRLTVAFALAAGTFALIFVLFPAGFIPDLGSPNEYVRLIQKTVFIAGVFGLAGYFARQAHQHRSMSNWATSLAVQLQTFDAYIAAIDDSGVKNELRQVFGARVFGDHPAMRGEPAGAPSATAVEAAAGLLAKLTASSAK